MKGKHILIEDRWSLLGHCWSPKRVIPQKIQKLPISVMSRGGKFTLSCSPRVALVRLESTSVGPTELFAIFINRASRNDVNADMFAMFITQASSLYVHPEIATSESSIDICRVS